MPARRWTLARSRYRDGVEQFVTVLDAERTLLAAQQETAQSATNVAVDIVALYKALGGGWGKSVPAAAASAADRRAAGIVSNSLFHYGRGNYSNATESPRRSHSSVIPAAIFCNSSTEIS